MKKMNATETETKLAVSTPELMKMTSLGRFSAEKIGNLAGAKIKIGRRVLWSVPKIQAYLDSITG